MTGRTPPARDQELEQQLRESELRVEDLTREVQQLQLVNEEQATCVQQKDGQIEQVQYQNQELNIEIKNLKLVVERTSRW